MLVHPRRLRRNGVVHAAIDLLDLRVLLLQVGGELLLERARDRPHLLPRLLHELVRGLRHGCHRVCGGLGSRLHLLAERGDGLLRVRVQRVDVTHEQLLRFIVAGLHARQGLLHRGAHAIFGVRNSGLDLVPRRRAVQHVHQVVQALLVVLHLRGDLAERVHLELADARDDVLHLPAQLVQLGPLHLDCMQVPDGVLHRSQRLHEPARVLRLLVLRAAVLLDLLLQPLQLLLHLDARGLLLEHQRLELVHAVLELTRHRAARPLRPRGIGGRRRLVCGAPRRRRRLARPANPRAVAPQRRSPLRHAAEPRHWRTTGCARESPTTAV